MSASNDGRVDLEVDRTSVSTDPREAKTSNERFNRASRGWLIEGKIGGVPAWWNGMRFDLTDDKAWDFESTKAIVFADWASASAMLNNLRVETMQHSERRGPHTVMETMQLMPTEHAWPAPESRDG